MESVPAPTLTLPQIGFMPSSIPSGDFFQLLLYVALLIYVIFTGILFYHWFAYASDKKVATATYAAYLIITVPMILTLITTSVIIN
ncbi:MAG: hypothetical protein AAB618_02775 [Patescibacteria group bacterium]